MQHVCDAACACPWKHHNREGENALVSLQHQKQTGPAVLCCRHLPSCTSLLVAGGVRMGRAMSLGVARDALAARGGVPALWRGLCCAKDCLPAVSHRRAKKEGGQNVNYCPPPFYALHRLCSFALRSRAARTPPLELFVLGKRQRCRGAGARL